MNPQFPIYIVSKGRYEQRITPRALDRIGVPYHIIVEEQEYDLYAEHISKDKILVLDPQFKRDYELLDDLGLSKSTGPGPARNFAWQHAIDSGYEWHWVCDDNIHHFERLYLNQKIRVGDGTIFRCMEDFVLRYDNIAMAGPNYCKFAKRASTLPPFVANTRIYSCNLIRNDLPFRWRGRYNEDTILSLDILKAGLCTIQFNAFLQEKLTTQRISGGNTTEFYASEGTKLKSEMLKLAHPDVTELVWKFNRHHHEVDYRPFKMNTLVRKPDYNEPSEPNEYGMKIVQRTDIEPV
jgi:hypothetical protein